MESLPELAGPYVVLVVEDEFAVRMVAIEALIDAGFTTHKAKHVAAALKVLRATDVHVLGDLGGAMLAREIKLRWLWAGLLIASAYPRREISAMPPGD
jgi:DNA-binding response OmpR family regulator